MSKEHPTHTETVEAIREQVADYVTQRARQGRPITFVQACRGHREVCLEAVNASTDPTWRDRVQALDEILAREGVAVEDYAR